MSLEQNYDQYKWLSNKISDSSDIVTKNHKEKNYWSGYVPNSTKSVCVFKSST
jgi:hypothetical protein